MPDRLVDPPFDYTHCPAAEACLLHEYRIHQMPLGIRYGCLGGKSDLTTFIPEWAAWVCQAAALAHKRLRIANRLPRRTDPEMIDHTRRFRAAAR